MNLRAIATATPAWRVSSETIAEWSGLDPKFIMEKIGVTSRAFLSHAESTVSLAQAACEALFSENPELEPGNIGLLILVTQNPDFKLPHSSAYLQHALGLSPHTPCFDMNLGCSGYVYALSVAKGLMVVEPIENAIIVTCDPYSKIMSRDSREVIGLFGDGATATWLSAAKGARIGSADFGTDGSGAHNLIVRGGGTAEPEVHLDNAPVKAPKGDGRLHMNGRAIFNFMLSRVPETTRRCLDLNRLALPDIDRFVFHQASRFLLETLADRMGLAHDKVPIRLADTGNTVSSTIPMVLADMIAKGEHAGSTVLISGFGVGLSWATNILFFGDGR